MVQYTAYAAAQPPAYGGQPPASYGGPHPHWGAAQPMQVAPKSPAIALLASFFLPGLGSMMNVAAGKGVGILIGWIVSVFLIVILIGFLGMLGFWVWGMADAYQGARKWNFAHGILS